MRTLPQTRDLVLVGGGHAHALVLRAWAMDPLAGARLTLIDPAPATPYTGMLPGLVAGHYTPADVAIDLVRLARAAGARLIQGRAEGLDPVAGRVHVRGRPPVAFDVAALDIGIGTGLPDLPGFADYGVAAKPMPDFARAWGAFLARGGAAEVAIIGAGLAGVELAMAIDHRLRDRPARRITLIEAAPVALAALPAWVRGRLLAELRRRGIAVRVGAAVASVGPAGVVLAGGAVVPAGLVVGAAGARPQAWLEGTGLHLTRGFVTVGPTLASVSHPMVFASGDCAHFAPAPRPKAGVYAVRQAPVLLANLRAALMGRPLRPWRAQRDHLKLVALGDRRAVAEKWGIPLPVPHALAWRIKDRIDRRFMAMFATLPAMAPHPLPKDASAGMAEALGDKPLCGGCGAKLGPGLLGRVLAGLPGTVGLGDDAAVLQVGGALQVIATDHLRALTLDPFLMGRIAAVHALGDIHAMGARPQAALAQVVLPPLAEALQERTLAELMAGITAALAQAGAVLVGGHSTQGAELVVGLTVTGLAGDKVLTKAGARPGDALVLTRPLGSGTILAAEMAGAAPGAVAAALLAALPQDQGAAAAVLVPVARAMTDVTGFGLAGHLDEMLRSQGLTADLDLGAVPVFDGAEGLAAGGWQSTVAPANRAALLGRIAAPVTPRAGLLFDPQTCGGLLAALPEAEVPPALAALAAAGYTAARIGTIGAADPDRPAIRVI